jgi:hypothetical protein
VPIVSIETHIRASFIVKADGTCDVFIGQQHNRSENAFLLASSTRNDGAGKETGAREPAIRFRGNDTPSALIRRPGECEGDWGGVPTKGEREDTSSSSKNEGVENAKKAMGIIGAYHDPAVAYKS